MYAVENNNWLCGSSNYIWIPELTAAQPPKTYVPWWSRYFVGQYFYNTTIGSTNLGDGGRPRVKALFCPDQPLEQFDVKSSKFTSAIGYNSTPNCHLAPAVGGAKFNEVVSPAKCIMLLDTNASYAWKNKGNWYQPRRLPQQHPLQQRNLPHVRLRRLPPPRRCLHGRLL